jgi:hypothetical protein
MELALGRSGDLAVEGSEQRRRHETLDRLRLVRAQRVQLADGIGAIRLASKDLD